MEVVASALIVAGALLSVLAAIGMLRFSDVFARMHAATKPATLGLILILTAAVLVLPDSRSITKLVLVILFQFITAPLGAHLIGRATFRSDVDLDPDTILDDVARSARRR